VGASDGTGGQRWWWRAVGAAAAPVAVSVAVAAAVARAVAGAGAPAVAPAVAPVVAATVRMISVSAAPAASEAAIATSEVSARRRRRGVSGATSPIPPTDRADGGVCPAQP